MFGFQLWILFLLRVAFQWDCDRFRITYENIWLMTDISSSKMLIDVDVRNKALEVPNTILGFYVGPKIRK